MNLPQRAIDGDPVSRWDISTSESNKPCGVCDDHPEIYGKSKIIIERHLVFYKVDEANKMINLIKGVTRSFNKMIWGHPRFN